MAQFALEVLDSSFVCLKTLDSESGLLSGILSAIFVIDWECNLGRALDDSLEDRTRGNITARFTFGEFVHTLCGRIDNQFWKNISLDTQKKLKTILIQSVRSAVFIEDKLVTDEITSLSCTWVLEILEWLCVNGNDEQKLLQQLLSRDETWPVFVVPNFSLKKVFTLDMSVPLK